VAGPDASHLPVMPDEVLAYLRPQPGQWYLDGTVGGGGHARLILESSGPDSRLIGLDRDPEALLRAGRVLAPFGTRVVLRQSNFSQAESVLQDLQVATVDGILLDLGVSSFQLDTPERGFSFRADAPLDMRMDPTEEETAREAVNNSSEAELKGIFRDLGEERWAGRIARRIVLSRREVPIETTGQLADLVREAVPARERHGRIHPATRVFQALRIYVNRELDHVAAGVEKAIDLLQPEGRLVVISFHSLEDRIVKRLFRGAAQGCICPPRLPICQCQHTARVELLTRRGIRPGEGETDTNPRARSAVLRAVRRLA